MHVKNKKYVNANASDNAYVNVKVNPNIRLNRLTHKDNSSKSRKRAVPFLCVLLSWSAFITPTKAMDGEKEKFPDWPGVFSIPRYGNRDPLGPHILGYLDNRSLRKAAQVSKGWRDSASQIQSQRQTLYSLVDPSSLTPEDMFAEKKRLFSLILDLTESEPNEVQRAKDSILSFLNCTKLSSQNALYHKLTGLLKDLDQPEALIAPEHHQKLIQASKLTQNHPTLTRLRSVIEGLQALSQCNLTLFSIFSPLINHYQLYIDRLLLANTEEDRERHLEPKVIMSGEGLVHLPDQGRLGILGGLENLEDAESLENFRPLRDEKRQVSSPGVSSYRISQQKAKALFSLNGNGEMTQSNTEGSHYVTLWNGPQGGLVCKSCLGVSAGLPVGMESAMYWFSKVLFGRGMAVSSLLTFKGLNVNSKHLEGDFYYDSNYHLIQAADKVEGMSLEKFIEKCHQEPSSYNYDQLDLTSFGEQVIISLLTNPTDGKPDNFFVTPDKQHPGKYLIVGIDNDLALKNTFNKRENKHTKHSTEKNEPACGVNLSNILYCLPLMNEDLAKSPALLEKMSNLNEQLTILKWLGLLRAQQVEYSLLQQTGHLSKQQVKSIQQLNLPLKLPADVLGFMKETLEKIAQTIEGHSGHLTYWKLFDEVNPLAKEFYHKISSTVTELSKLGGKPLPKRDSDFSQKIYEELSTKPHREASFNILNQKSFDPIMGAYFCIHHTKTFYLETVLKADMYRRTSDGRLAWESINCIPSSGTGNTKTVDELCQDFLATLDLTKQKNKAPFVELGLIYFKDILQLGMDKRKREQGQEQKKKLGQGQDQTQDQNDDHGSPPILSSLHASWEDPLLLLNFLEEKVSEEAIDCLLNWGWDAGVCHPVTQRNALHYGALHNSSYEILHKILSKASTIKEKLQEHDKTQLLNAKDQDNQTPLDLAIKHKRATAFISLLKLGAEKCGVKQTYQFYCQTALQEQNQELSALQEVFVQLIKRHEELNWTIGWHHLCHPMRREQNEEMFTLPAWVQSQVMDHNDEFIHYVADPEKRLGNHVVARAEAFSQEDLRKKKKEEANQREIIPSPDTTPQTKVGYRQPFPLPLITHHIYFKEYPELPGLEEAVGRLTRMILGFGAPFTELVRINNKPVMLSQGIQGRNLLDVLKNEPELLKQLDLESVSGLILLAMLTNPEDGKPDNYIVEPHLDKYRLVCVDNDHAFVPAVGRQTPEDAQDQTKQLVVQVKSVLYCLDQMNEEIPASIKKLFLNINPYTLLKEWLTGLQTLQDNYTQKLFKGSHDHGFLRGHDNCCLKVSFPYNGIKDLFQKFLYMRDIFSLSNHKLTHIGLLERLEHFLAQRYAPLLRENISVYERFKKIDGPFYLMNQNGSFSTQTKSQQIIESQYIQEKQTLWESIMGDHTDDPTKAIQILETVKEKKEAEALSSFFKRAFGQQEIPESELKRQELFSSLDFANLKGVLSISEQQAFLDHLRHYKLLNTLRFKNCEFLTDEAILNLDLAHLRKLDLRGCQQVSNKTLIFLSETAKRLKSLNLGGITTLTEIGQTNFFGALTEAPLVFPTLTFLHLADCSQLRRIFIKAPELHYLNITNCVFLNDQMLDGAVDYSPSLQKLVFKGCPRVGEREMREKYPNFPAGYWKGVKERESIVKILESKGQVLEFSTRKIDTSPEGLRAFGGALQSNPHLSNLTTLDLQDNNLKAEGAKTLASGNLSALTRLNLGGNLLGAEGARALASGKVTALKMLILNENNIGDAGAEALASGNLPTLRKLVLATNKVGAEGAKALANGNFTALRSLQLAFNNLRDEGAKALASGNLTALAVLELRRNGIRDAGAKALASGNLIVLQKLELWGNKIGDESREALRKGCRNAQINF